MKCFLVLCLVIVATVLIDPILSTCSRGSIQMVMDDKGNIDQWCDGPNGRMEVDSETVRDQCTDCSCSKDGLSCCGVGYKSASFHYEGCEMKKETDTCCFQFFKIDDPTKSCTNKTCPSN